jgi:hypothetical protein
MNEERRKRMLTTHPEQLTDEPEAVQWIDTNDEEKRRAAALLQLAERLQQSMQPVQPSTDFVRGLGRDLVDRARRQVRLANRLRRAALIGAATLGSLLSIASVVGAVVFVVVRLRARAQARAIQAPTG